MFLDPSFYCYLILLNYVITIFLRPPTNSFFREDIFYGWPLTWFLSRQSSNFFCCLTHFAIWWTNHHFLRPIEKLYQAHFSRPPAPLWSKHFGSVHKMWLEKMRSRTEKIECTLWEVWRIETFFLKLEYFWIVKSN